MVDPSFWRGRRVFVTGHTGFKGGWLTLWLASLGAEVTGFALTPETTPNLFSVAKVDRVCSSIIGDVRDIDTLTNAVRKAAPEIVLHLAAQPLVRRSYGQPVETYATNVMGTVHCLEAARQTPGVRAVVVVTSDKCYENRNWVWAYRENEAMGGHDPYSNSKGCSELVTAAYRDSFFAGAEGSCRVASGRAGNVIGGGDWSEDRLIPDMIRAFEAGRSVEIRAPTATRPWQHVLEPLHGYLALAERLAAAEARCDEGWNFGPADADCKPVSYIVERLVKGWGETASFHLATAPQPHEAFLLKVDASKAIARLGWRPLLDLDQALDWTLEWYRSAWRGDDAAALCRDQIGHFQRLAFGSDQVAVRTTASPRPLASV